MEKVEPIRRHGLSADGTLSLPSSASALPADLLSEATHRVAIVAAAAAFASTFFFLATELFGFMRVPCPLLRYVLFPFFILVSTAMFLLARSGRLPCPKLHIISLGYQVLAAFLIAVQVNAQPWPDEIALPAWSPVAVWVLAYPMVVPTPPKRTLLAATLAAAMDPLSVLLLVSIPVIAAPENGVLIRRFMPNVVAVILAYAVSRAMFRYGAKLSQARELGAYRLVAALGTGGMGEVWRAEHRMLARPAAVKLILPERLGAGDNGVDRSALIRRFEREAQATALLFSPHTIEVYDFGVNADGTLYYVMELLDGINLNSLVKKHGPQPPERVVHILRQACHSLHEAHLSGLIHRDIKPSNLFLCRYGTEVDFLKVLDFGLVKVRRPDRDGETLLTREGTATGTPAYMPPEIALNERAIDARADIYALGCVAYWLLTGELVFEADSSMKVLVMHVKDEPVPPSQRTELDIPPALEAIVMDCLAKDPDRRPATARALSDRLRDLRIEERWTEARAQAWWDTHCPSHHVSSRVVTESPLQTVTSS